MDRQTFRTFVGDLLNRPKERSDFLSHLVFNSWKSRLSPKQRRYVPKIRCKLIFLLKYIDGPTLI